MRKLSDLGTDECLNVLCEITPFVSNIVSDQELMENLGKGVDKKGMTNVGVIMLGIKRMFNAVPLLLKNHREDIYNVVSAVGGEMTTEEIAAQNIMVTLNQVRSLSHDKVLIDFFKSWVRGEEAE